MFDEMWQEIQDAPGEIFDLPELRDEEDFNLNEYINGNIDYWMMTPDTLNFTGDAVTYLGFVGVISTLIILVTSFRRYFNSPLRK